MPNFGHMKNDMSKNRHIKNYIIQDEKKHLNTVFQSVRGAFMSVWLYERDVNGKLLVIVSIVDPEFCVFWQSALTTGH